MDAVSERVEASASEPLERVRTFLARHGLEGGLVTFGCSTETAQMTADAVGCEPGRIVKSLVFVVDARPVLALVAGDRKGDAKAIARELGGKRARFADPETVFAATGYVTGAVSPFDLPADLPVLVDESLERFDVVYPAAGTTSSCVRIELHELLRVTGGRLVQISQ